MAASALLVVPILALFFFAQKTFIQGISTTGMGGREDEATGSRNTRERRAQCRGVRFLKLSADCGVLWP